MHITEDLLSIWRAGVDAVAAEVLVQRAVIRQGNQLIIGETTHDLTLIDRIAVVGGGKAGAGMVRGLAAVLGPELWAQKVTGWVNVPADCVAQDERVTLHPARPAGINEPTAAGVHGSEEILRIVGSLTPRDLCVVLLSGGGSALLPAPCSGITLEDKLAVTRWLSRAGATIQQLNTVRKHLSRIKGGGLARACRAGQTEVLVISDVIGNPLDIIASGPTVPDRSTAAEALQILEQLGATRETIPASVFNVLESQVAQETATGTSLAFPTTHIRQHLIGENRVAIEAARQQAASLGYEVRVLGLDQAGTADETGRELAATLIAVRDEVRGTSRRICLLSGGEPVVKLSPSAQPRRGGRNQQLILAALCELWRTPLTGLGLLSGGTDGEDGPTDAAGAWLDAAIFQRAQQTGLDPQAYLAIQNAYPILKEAGALLFTGPTHTNVMDVRVGLVVDE